MTIIIDRREPFEFQRIGDEVKQLEYGDAIIHTDSKDIIVERKTPTGFWTDLKSGRLNDQLTGCDVLAIFGPYGILPYSREDSPDEDYSTTKRYVDAINGISNHHIVWHVNNIIHYENTLRRYEAQLIDGKFGNLRLFNKKPKLQTPIRILSEFNGIAIEKAKLLLQSYGTLEGVFGAAYERMKIENIGEKTLENIERDLKEKYVREI